MAALQDVEVAAADAGRLHLEQHLLLRWQRQQFLAVLLWDKPVAQLWSGHVRQSKLPVPGVEHCLHRRPRTADRPRPRFYTLGGKPPGPSELTPTLLWVIISLTQV